MTNARKLILVFSALALGLLGLAAAGCGGSSTSSPPTPSSAAPPTTPTTGSASTTPAPAAGATPVTVALAKGREFTIAPDAPSAPAGKVTFTVTNYGKMTHEMVIVPSPAGGGKALAKADGTANETGALGETKDVPAGGTKSFAVDLKPGKYILLCNLPGHFAGGMWVEFSVV